MITEIVLWRMPEGMKREEILAKFRASVPTWQCPPSALMGQMRRIEEGSVSGSS
jgi:hypothetical protein